MATGEHASGHFALYYGFVPQHNPHDELVLSLPTLTALLGMADPRLGGGAPSPLPPDWGPYWERGVAELAPPPAEGGDPLYYALRAAPSRELLVALTKLLPPSADGSPTEAAALRALSSVAAALEAALWGGGAPSEGIASDEALLAGGTDEAAARAEPQGALSERGALLVVGRP